MPHKHYIPKFFARLGLSCDHLPDYVYEQAQEIINRLENRAHFQSAKGKRMLFNKTNVCIMVDRKHHLYAWPPVIYSPFDGEMAA